MIGFFLMIGKQGSGKTLMAVKHVHDNKDGRPIFSNCTLKGGIKYEQITFASDRPEDQHKTDILKTLDTNPNYFDNSIMLLDEIHIYADSLDFMKKNNRRLQRFFSQIRKRRILLLGTTQYLMNLDVRIRRQIMNIQEMEHISKTIFKVTTHDIDGYFSKEVSSYFLDLGEYYNLYDTNEVIS